MTFIPNEDYFFKVAKGEITGASVGRKFGHSENLSTTEQLISFNSPTAPPQLTAAATVDVSSNSANDTNTAGTGARKLYIEGLDSNFDVISETINLNGTSAVTSSNSYIRLYRAYVSEVGIYGGTNAGNITIVSGATTMLVVEAGMGQTENTFYTVPNGYSLYIIDVHLNIETNKAVEVTFYQMLNADDVSTPFTGVKRIVQHYTGLVDGNDFDYKNAYIKFTEKTDLWFTGKTSTGTANGSVEYTYILIQN